MSAVAISLEEVRKSRFYRPNAAKNEAIPGTGLGLSIVKSIVTAHGGTGHVRERGGRRNDLRRDLAMCAGCCSVPGGLTRVDRFSVRLTSLR
jgi:signal transduction histidine kinase